MGINNISEHCEERKIHYLHVTLRVYLLDSTCSPSMLLALQYTCWPLSSGTPVYCRTETVLYRSLASCWIEVVIWVKIPEFSLYQVMLAAGLTRSSVIQVMLMDLDALTVVWGVDNVSVDTGTVRRKKLFYFYYAFMNFL